MTVAFIEDNGKMIKCKDMEKYSTIMDLLPIKDNGNRDVSMEKVWSSMILQKYYLLYSIIPILHRLAINGTVIKDNSLKTLNTVKEKYI